MALKPMVEQLIKRGLSQRAACRHLRLDRSAMRYVARPASGLNEAIREELRRLAHRHRRYGSPRMTDLIQRNIGWVNHKRVERLWQEESLSLPRRTKRKRRGVRLEPRPRPASQANEVWSYDFIFERTQHGKKLKTLSVVDEYTRECLELRVGTRMRSKEVLETLDELMTERGCPKYVRSDNGPEFVAKELRKWLKDKGVEPIFIEPGSPWENGYMESFHGKLRDECLNEEIFWSGKEAQVVMDWYREVYNQYRPHSSLGYKTPYEAARGLDKQPLDSPKNW